jgi:NADH pyrophosphatase NudC (nudix superfamily)
MRVIYVNAEVVHVATGGRVNFELGRCKSISRKNTRKRFDDKRCGSKCPMEGERACRNDNCGHRQHCQPARYAGHLSKASA